MLFVLGILFMVFGILFSIAWHELGHFIPAKKFGVKVTQFMVGFGPTMFSRNRGETELGVKWIPLGGYIRMIGMYPPGPDGKVKASSTGRLGTLMEEARQASQAEVLTPADEKRTFYNLSVPKKLVVMLGGPTMNLILATILFAIVLVGFGTPTPSTTLSRVPATYAPTEFTGNSSGTGSNSDSSQSTAAKELPTPAAQAGIQPGDTIISYNGENVTSWAQLSDLIRQTPAEQIPVVVERNGQQLTKSVAVVQVERPVIVDGKPTKQLQPQGFLGVSPQIDAVKQPITVVPGYMWDLTIRSGQALLSFPAKLVGVAQAAFAGDQRDPEGPVGVVGVGRISGEVAAEEQIPAQWRFAQMLGILASLNLFLFLFNLIPLLPLDGGHVAGALWEGARRRLAKLRGLPDPGPVDVAKLLPVAYVVAIVLIGMSVLLVYADIVNPIRLG